MIAPALSIKIAAAVLVVAGAFGTGAVLGQRSQARRAASAELVASEAKGEAHAALQREQEAKDRASNAAGQALELEREVQRIRAKLAAMPKDPGPSYVAPPPSLSAAQNELVRLGIGPRVDPAGLVLSLQDATTTIQWGRDAQRVGPLAARLEASIALTTAQEGARVALLSQVEAATTALGACDDRAEAFKRQAEALQAALASERKTQTVTVWKTRLKWGSVAVGAAGVAYLIGRRR